MVMGSDDEEERALMAGGSSRCEWHPATVACLLDSYGVKCTHIKGYLKIKDWEDIVRDVNAHEYYESAAKTAPKTMKQCRDKVENLKRRYKLEKRRSDSRGPRTVTWSFFHKLDHIMTALNKTGNVLDSGDDEMGQSQSYEGMDCDLPEGFAGESMPLPLSLPLPVISDVVLSVDDILNTVGYNRASSRLDFQDSSSPDKKPPKRKKPSSNSSSSPFSKKRKAPKPPPAAASASSSSNPVQALADALVGFSEVYARIEIAKMEMFTKLVLELAKIHSKRRKKSDAGSAPADPK